MKNPVFFTVTYALLALVYTALWAWNLLRGDISGLTHMVGLCAFVHWTAAILWARRAQKAGKDDG